MLTDEEKAFLDLLYRRLKKTLYIRSYRLLAGTPDAENVAWECVHDTFLLASRKVRRLMGHEFPERWIMNACSKITVSQRRKQYRRAKRLGFPQPIEAAEKEPDPHDDIEDWLISEQAERRLQQLADMLTDEEEAVFKAHYQKQMSVHETALHLHISDGAVRGAVQRIRKKCREKELQ